MTAAPSSVPSGGGDERTWVEATPAEVRATLAPESAAEFDQQWRAALERAADTYDLTIVHDCLDAWRRVARVTAAAGGDEGYRALRDKAAAALGGAAPGSGASWHEVRVELGI